MNTMKYLLSGGLIGLLLSSALMMIVLYRLSPIFQSRRQGSLRDQHIDPVLFFRAFWGCEFARDLPGIYRGFAGDRPGGKPKGYKIFREIRTIGTVTRLLIVGGHGHFLRLRILRNQMIPDPPPPRR